MNKGHLTSIMLGCLISNLSVVADEWPQFAGPTSDFGIRLPDSLDASHAPTKRWQRDLGEGMSGVVARDGLVFTSYLEPFSSEELEQEESKRTHREVIIAMDADNGETTWRHEYVVGWIDDQQAFGGRLRAPQATPAICGDYLVAVGFTGIIHCLDQKTGDVVWSKQAVKEFESTPVQFGFSASPLPVGDSVVVLVGGKKGGLVCLDVKSGVVQWKVPCNEASYATPVLWKRPDGDQIVFVTRNRVVGVEAASGNELWSHPFTEAGLTNVPTPMPIDDVGLLISGQGVKGTRRIDVVRGSEAFEVTEAWANKEQFFYCNWVRRGDVLWGCNGSLLLTIDLSSGVTVGRFRGYNDANILLAKDQMLVYHGDGHLSQLRVSDSEATALAKYAVLNERCWTPPTQVGGLLYCRGGDQLLCLDLFGGDPRAAVTSARIRKAELKLRTNRSNEEEQDTDPLQQIVTAFEKQGPEQAWKIYNDLRNDDPDSIPFDDRQELASMARREGLVDIAKTVLQHAAEDFPKLAEAMRPPSSETTLGENGLLYLEFAIRNTGWRTIQAYVKGPEKHPFSYGLPLRPKQARREKWPVGTRLYRTQSGVKKELLLTVKKEFAGRTIDVPATAGESQR